MVLKFVKGYIILFLCLPGFVFAQDYPDVYISNQGKDNNPGTSTFFPRKTITATKSLLKGVAEIKGSVKLGLRSGDMFSESLVTSYPIEVKTYKDQFGNNDFAVINGAKEFSNGWVKEPGTNYTFEQGISYTGFINHDIGSYDYIYVVEIDKALEKTMPFTARKLLVFDTSLADLEITPGSFYSSINSTENPKRMYIHTSDGSSPNNNMKYRYEVTVRDYAVNSSFQPNNVFENLWVTGGGAGYGMLAGGSNSSYNKIIFGPGTGIHHLVVRSGIINHSLFLPAATNINDIAVVFYDADGLNRYCAIKNSIFLDIKQPVYSHISSGTNYNKLEMTNIVAFSDNTQQGAFMGASNTDTILLHNIYADGYNGGYGNSNASYSVISNSYFKDVSFGIGYGANPTTSLADNIFIKTKTFFSEPQGIVMQPNTSLQLTHSILHIYTPFQTLGSFVSGSGAPGNKIISLGNIFICDLPSSQSLLAATTNTDNGIATSYDQWDYNVYILLRGTNILWQVSNAVTNKGSFFVKDFSEWKKQSGQDKHSLFFDLTNDPRGLKAIFTDPDNGNYELANTPEAKEIAALGAGMTDPLSCFLKKPSYEKAADMIRNNAIFSVNSCRNPCVQNVLRVNNTLQVTRNNGNKAIIQWTIGEQHNIDHYELQRAAGNSLFKKIADVSIGSDSVYSFIDYVQPGLLYQYRLLVFALAGNACYSDTKSLRVDYNRAKPFTIYPNPSTGKVCISLNGYLGKSNLTILNSNGEPILIREFFSLYAPQMLDMSKQPKGIYFIKLQTLDGIVTQKFIIQ